MKYLAKSFKSKQQELKSKSTYNPFTKFVKLVSPHPKGERVFLEVLFGLKKEKKRKPTVYFATALRGLMPGLHLIKKVKSGKSKDFPGYVKELKAFNYAVKWTLESAHKRNRRLSLSEQITDDLTLAMVRKGWPFKLKKQLAETLKAIKKFYDQDKKRKKRKFRKRFRRLTLELLRRLKRRKKLQRTKQPTALEQASKPDVENKPKDIKANPLNTDQKDIRITNIKEEKRDKTVKPVRNNKIISNNAHNRNIDNKKPLIQINRTSQKEEPVEPSHIIMLRKHSRMLKVERLKSATKILRKGYKKVLLRHKKTELETFNFPRTYKKKKLNEPAVENFDDIWNTLTNELNKTNANKIKINSNKNDKNKNKR